MSRCQQNQCTLWPLWGTNSDHHVSGLVGWIRVTPECGKVTLPHPVARASLAPRLRAVILHQHHLSQPTNTSILLNNSMFTSHLTQLTPKPLQNALPISSTPGSTPSPHTTPIKAPHSSHYYHPLSTHNHNNRKWGTYANANIPPAASMNTTSRAATSPPTTTTVTSGKPTATMIMASAMAITSTLAGQK